MTFPSTPAVNLNGLLNGAIAAVGIHPWVSNYGYTPSACVDLGALNDINISHEVKLQKFEADNVLAPIGASITGEEFKITGKLLQYDLKVLSRLTGSSNDGSDVTVVNKTTTDGSVTWGRGSIHNLNYYTIHLHCEGLNLQFPWGGNSGADVYTKLDIIIPKAIPVVKTSQAFKKNGQWEFPFELEAFHDSSVTTAGLELFKIVLTAPV